MAAPTIPANRPQTTRRTTRKTTLKTTRKLHRHLSGHALGALRQVPELVVRLGNLRLDRLVILAAYGEVDLVVRLLHRRVPLARTAKS